MILMPLGGIFIGVLMASLGYPLLNNEGFIIKNIIITLSITALWCIVISAIYIKGDKWIMTKNTLEKNKTRVKHDDHGQGIFVEYCNDPAYVQVLFDKEPKRPDGVDQSCNPLVVRVNELKMKVKWWVN